MTWEAAAAEASERRSGARMKEPTESGEVSLKTRSMLRNRPGARGRGSGQTDADAGPSRGRQPGTRSSDAAAGQRGALGEHGGRTGEPAEEQVSGDVRASSTSAS